MTYTTIIFSVNVSCFQIIAQFLFLFFSLQEWNKIASFRVEIYRTQNLKTNFYMLRQRLARTDQIAGIPYQFLLYFNDNLSFN